MDEEQAMSQRPGRIPLVVALVVGLGLVVAPFAFQMFSRAPEGGVMIDEFEPYMTRAKIEEFRGYLDEIGAAEEQAGQALVPALVDAGAIGDDGAELSGVTALNETWPAIEADMDDLLDRMEANLDSYRAVAALPPFPLFPWFFVVPGALIAAMAGWGLWSGRSSRPSRAPRWALVVLGAGVALAPFAFQMFGRAPQGRDMIDDFRPMMTRERVRDVQGYFITMGVAEGQLRTVAVPLASDNGIDPESTTAIATFSEDWPGIVADFNPMVATMSDNVENFAAVDAMPAFNLFPWFFLVPGIVVAACGAVALRSIPTSTPPPEGELP